MGAHVRSFSAELPVWDLSPILPTGAQQARAELEQRTSEFQAWKPKLAGLTPAQFSQAADDYAAIFLRMSKYFKDPDLRFSENTADQTASAAATQARTVYTGLQNNLLFFTDWFKDLPDDAAARYVAASGPHRKYFELIRQRKPYLLDEKGERIVNTKNANGVNALRKIFTVMTSAFTYPVQGKQLTRDQLTVACKDPSPAIREEAYRAMLDKQDAHKNVLGELYRAIVSDWHEEYVTLRSYASPIHARNEMNDLPNEAVDAVMRVTERNWQIFHRFFALKQQKLGLPKFTRFDVYAPLGSQPYPMPFDEAVSLISESFKQFSPEFERHAMDMLRQNRVHARVQPNKRTGAFCSWPGVDMHPYVLVNYAGTFQDGRTLAHELGHAVHFILANKHSTLTCMPGLPVAETASTFAETLFSAHVMQKAPERAEELLFRQLDDAYATIIRQVGFVQFEVQAHDLIRQGKTLDALDAAYLDLLRKNVGPGVDVDPAFGREWYGIPHIFHTPFYCYAYAFGNLLAYALYEQFRKQGARAVPGILEFFAAGGNEAPVDIARKVGVDITSDAFWQQAFDYLDDIVRQLEKS